MACIHEVVQRVFARGFLSLETELQLQKLLETQYDLKDFNAFMNLQWAIMDGKVCQESREIHRHRSAKCH